MDITKCVILSNLSNPGTEDISQREYGSMCCSLNHGLAI